MALIKKQKLTIYDRTPYGITGRDGKKYEGFIYDGFDERNRTVRFTSADGKIRVDDSDSFEEGKAQGFTLHGTTRMEGGVKWSTEQKEKKNLDRDFSKDEDVEF